MQLIFDPVQQVLKFIEFYELGKVALRYGRVVIFGGDVDATFMSVYNVRSSGCSLYPMRSLG